MEVTIHPLWEKNGKISRFLEISHDITERKLKEEENRRRLEQMVDERTRQLQETHAKLLHQDKMASLGKLSASVVHEINNPDCRHILNLILLMKRIMKEDRATTPFGGTNSFDRYLTLMEAETRRISRIVANLLTFSRQSKMEMGEQDCQPADRKNPGSQRQPAENPPRQDSKGTGSRPAPGGRVCRSIAAGVHEHGVQCRRSDGGQRAAAC